MASSSRESKQLQGSSDSGEKTGEWGTGRKVTYKLRPEEEEVVEFENDGSSEVRQRMDLCLVGNVVSRRPFNMMAMRDSLKRCWRLVHGVEIKRTRGIENRFLFQFQIEGDKEWVLEREPWSFDMLLIVFHALSANELADEVDLRFTPFWIQLHNLPRNRREEDSIRKICGVFAKFIDLDRETGMDGDGFVRARVSVDIKKPLIRGRYIRHDNDKHWIKFKYERLPMFCYVCGLFGHMLKDCERHAELVQDGITQYDVSLRALPYFKRDHKYAFSNFKIEGKGKTSPLKFWPGSSPPRERATQKMLQLEEPRSNTDNLADLDGVVNKVRAVSLQKKEVREVDKNEGKKGELREQNKRELMMIEKPPVRIVKRRGGADEEGDETDRDRLGELRRETKKLAMIGTSELVDVEITSSQGSMMSGAVRGVHTNQILAPQYIFQAGAASPMMRTRKKYKATSQKKKSKNGEGTSGQHRSEGQEGSGADQFQKSSSIEKAGEISPSTAPNSATAGQEIQSRLAE